MEGGLLLDVVVAEGAAILELLAGEDKALLVGGDALLVLDLGLHVIDRVGGLDVEGDGLACRISERIRIRSRTEEDYIQRKCIYDYSQLSRLVDC